MPEEWLIDGYNLLRDQESSPTQAALTRWMHRLASFASAKNERSVLVVLDGQAPQGEWDALCTRVFRIVHSGKITADSVIEKYLCDNKGRMRMTVVTKDIAIGRMARGSGAAVIDPEEFRRVLADDEDEAKASLFRENVRGHGFHRPFGKKFKDAS